MEIRDQTFALQPKGFGAEEILQADDKGDELADDGRGGCPCHPPMEAENEYRVEYDVDDGTR